MNKIGLVLEGGAFRGIFTAGVLDYLMEHDVSFPYVCGVSAGSGNAVNFVSGQIGRTQRVITHDNADPYYGLGQLKRSGTLLDLDMMTYGYSKDQIPFDFETYFNSNIETEFVVANCETGKAEYLSADGDEDRLMALVKASCSVPLICKPVEIDGSFYLDGSLVDSVPAEHAFDEGHCDKVVVILTRRWEDQPPTDYSKMKTLLNVTYKSKFPKLVEVMLKRRESYEKQMLRLARYENSGKAFVIRPESMSISRFEGDMEKVNAFYKHGREIMDENLEALRDFMNS